MNNYTRFKQNIHILKRKISIANRMNYHIADDKNINLCHLPLKYFYQLITTDLYKRIGCEYYFVYEDIPEHKVCSSCIKSFLHRLTI